MGETMIADVHDPRPLTRSHTVFQGAKWSIHKDIFTLREGGEPLEREYLVHPGAVAVVALDERERILLLRQYRHPVRSSVWELPAGLLDKPGEDYHVAAAREFAEEADLQAAQWRVLHDVFTSEGAITEAVRTFVATGISPVPEGERYERTAEEVEITSVWVPLREAEGAVLEGRLHSATACLGILALSALMRRGALDDLQPANSPWPQRSWVPSAAPDAPA